MRVQPINSSIYYKNQNIKSSKTKPANLNNIPFNGYQEIPLNGYKNAMKEVLSNTLINRVDVANQIKKLFFNLRNEYGAIKKPIYDILWDWVGYKATFLVEELCKPLYKMEPALRNIVIDSKEKNISILEAPNNNELYIANLGKHGFWNSVFENESARNDIKLVFTSNIGNFELGTTDDGKLVTEQAYSDGYWEKSIFSKFLGDKIGHKTGNLSETIMWPSF